MVPHSVWNSEWYNLGRQINPQNYINALVVEIKAQEMFCLKN